MSRRNVLGMTVAALLFIGSGAEAQSQLRISQAVAPSTAELVQPAAPGLMKVILGQLMNSLGRPNIKLRIHVRTSSDKGTSIQDLDGQVDFRFRKDLNFPTQVMTGNKRMDQLIPIVNVGLEGRSMVMRVSSDEKQDVMTTEIRFQKSAAPVPVVVDVTSELMEIISFRLNGLTWTMKGRLDPKKTVLDVDGTCDMQQAVYNSVDKIIWQNTECRFAGTYNKETKKYDVDFYYDSYLR